ncbi:GxxExxY protein [Thermoplasmatales archaeon SW_10_69_26]|nr:MAG: GxxExxY protein [Thermoplasmatales archaeon SW_10_69_26]
MNALSRDVIGAAIEVHRELGPGLLERVYVECLAEALEDTGLSVAREVTIPARFRVRELEASYRIDLSIDERLVVEVKAAEDLHPVFKSQVLTYLEMANAPLGLLINFNVPQLVDGVERVAL